MGGGLFTIGIAEEDRHVSGALTAIGVRRRRRPSAPPFSPGPPVAHKLSCFEPKTAQNDDFPEVAAGAH